MNAPSFIKICVTGDVGSGKSSVCNALHQILSKEIKIDRFSTGDFQRTLAQEKKLTTLELNRFSESHSEIDHQIDAWSKQLNLEPKSFIVDSRLAWHFIKDSFKIYLHLKDEIAAKRIMQDPKRVDEKYPNLEEAIAAVKARKESERNRFLKLYQVDLRDDQHYHLLIETSKQPVEKIVAQILFYLKQWQSGKKVHEHLFFD